MARPLRIEFERAVYHVSARGNEKKAIFRDNVDYEKFLEILGGLPQRFNVIIHGYVLMRNHYHLLIETLRPNLSRTMHYLNAVYTGHFNQRHKRVGHLLQGRYKAFLIEKDRYLLSVSRYIHLNPVRAGVVLRPEEYKWSSYRDYVGRETGRTWLAREWVLGQFSDNLPEAKKLYRKFVKEGLEVPENPFQMLKAGLILGNEAFAKDIKEMISVRRHRDIPETKLLAKSIPCEEVIAAVVERFRINNRQITEAGMRNNLARKICLYLLRALTDMSNEDIGKKFDISYSAVSQSVSRIKKDMKNDSSIRSLVDDIEEKIGVRS